MMENKDFESNQLDSSTTQNEHMENFQIARPNVKFGISSNKILRNSMIVLAMTIGTTVFAQSTSKGDIRQEAKNTIKLGELAPKVKVFFDNIKAEIVFSKPEQEEFFDKGLAELEKKANTAKTLEELQAVIKQTNTFLAQFSGSKNKVISNHGEEVKFKKKDMEEAKESLSGIKKETAEVNNLFNKSTSDLGYDENAVDKTVLINLKNQMNEIKTSLDEQKKSLEGAKDQLGTNERDIGGLSSTLASKKIELEQLMRSYGVFKNNPPKTDVEAKGAKTLEDKITAMNKEIAALEAKFNDQNASNKDLQKQISQMDDQLDSTMTNYQNIVSKIHEEELIMYKKQQIDIKAKLDNSIDTLKTIIAGKNDIVLKLDNNLQTISTVIKDQTQSSSDNGDLEALQQKRLKNIQELTQVNQEMQKVVIQAQEHLKNNYDIQLKILGSSKEYYSQEKGLLSSAMKDMSTQTTTYKNEVQKLQEKKNGLKQGLDTLPNTAMAQRTKEILDIMTQITTLNKKIDQLEDDYDQKSKELAVVDKELMDINQVEKILESYNILIEYIVKLSEFGNDYQRDKLENDYTKRETTLQDDVYADLKQQLIEVKDSISQINIALRSKTLSLQDETANLNLLDLKTQEAVLLENQSNAMALSTELLKEKMKQELAKMAKLKEAIEEKIEQIKGRKVNNKIAKNTDDLGNNKYYDGSVPEPTILETQGIVNIELIQKLIAE